MDWKTFSAKIKSDHSGQMQHEWAIDRAMAELQSGLNALTRLGHPFHLEPGPPPVDKPWPRMFYHEDCHGGLLVHGPEYLVDLGPGWCDTLAEARQQAGLDTQFMGRGGVHRGGLPATQMNGKTTQARPMTRDERIEFARMALEKEISSHA